MVWAVTVRLLLDTHVVLWWLADSSSLLPTHRELIADTANQVFVSSVSVAEISIKASLGKLEAPENVEEAVVQSGFDLIDFRTDHAEALRALPWHHRDPFDRMLVVQATIDSLVLVTVDPRVRAYQIETR